MRNHESKKTILFFIHFGLDSGSNSGKMPKNGQGIGIVSALNLTHLWLTAIRKLQITEARQGRSVRIGATRRRGFRDDATLPLAAAG